MLTQPDDNRTSQSSRILITREDLMLAERAAKYKVQLQRPEVYPTEENWQYMTENAMGEVAPELYHKYLVTWLTPENDRSEFHLLTLEYVPDYLAAIDRDTALDAVYDDVATAPEASLGLIRDCALFSAPDLLGLLKKDIDVRFVALCLKAYQPDYDVEDLNDMQALLRKMQSLPELGEISESRGIFSRNEKYTCPKGHTNSADKEFCDCCGLNIYGLNKEEAGCIQLFASRTKTLAALLNPRTRR